MDKTLEIVERELVSHRLTVTPTRITIKFCLGTSDEEKRKVKEFFLEVAEDLKGKMLSMRGSLKEGCLRMENEARTDHKYYYMSYEKPGFPSP